MGDSVAKWDGDALVVDVNNLNDDTWLGPDGYFHTEAMHVVERFTRTGDAIELRGDGGGSERLHASPG